MKIKRIDHIGITVRDISAAIQFFVDIGLELVGEDTVEGEWVGRIVGLTGVKSKIAMLRTPDGNVDIELSQFLTPPSVEGSQDALVNALGIRHICFAVEDVDGLVAKMKSKSMDVVGEIVNYENFYKLCYVRGPEGILLEFAERLG